MNVVCNTGARQRKGIKMKCISCEVCGIGAPFIKTETGYLCQQHWPDEIKKAAQQTTKARAEICSPVICDYCRVKTVENCGACGSEYMLFDGRKLSPVA